MLTCLGSTWQQTWQALPSRISPQAIGPVLHLLACLPADVNLLSKGDGGIVVGDLTRGRAVAASERNAVVDVENSRLSARRPDHRGGGDLILLGVYLPINPGISASDGCLSRGL